MTAPTRTDQQIADVITLADAALAVAGHTTSDSSHALTERVLRGELDADVAVSEITAEAVNEDACVTRPERGFTVGSHG